jgi:hypothetical protein
MYMLILIFTYPLRCLRLPPGVRVPPVEYHWSIGLLSERDMSQCTVIRGRDKSDCAYVRVFFTYIDLQQSNERGDNFRLNIIFIKNVYFSLFPNLAISRIHHHHQPVCACVLVRRCKDVK